MLWLIGAHGLLGGYVRKLLKRRGVPHLATDREVDITDQGALIEFAQPHPIRVILNCAGFTDVRACEDEQRLAFLANAEAVRYLTQVAALKNAHLFQVSTDYVFDGKAGAPYVEDAPTNPLNAYGRSKLAGEEFLRAASCRWTLVRTSWLFGDGGYNFVSTVLSRLGATRAVRVVEDQFGKPTFAGDLAEVLLALVEAEPGVYHVANAGPVSWFAFAEEIARRAVEFGILDTPPVVEAICSEALEDPVVRPVYSALATNKVARILGRRPRPWRAALRDFMFQSLRQPVV